MLQAYDSEVQGATIASASNNYVNGKEIKTRALTFHHTFEVKGVQFERVVGHLVHGELLLHAHLRPRCGSLVRVEE